MDSTLFDLVEDGKSLTIYYGCRSYIPGMGGSIVLDMVFITPLFMSRQIVGKGFEVKYKMDSAYRRECTNWYGRCGYDLAANMTTCICPNQTVGSGGCEATSPTTLAIHQECFSFQFHLNKRWMFGSSI
ncbi:hypothetical protein Ancab_034800 [Ancistrocladus abbreviatus]